MSPVSILSIPDQPAVAAALDDLRRDLAAVFPFGKSAADRAWSLSVNIDANLAAETFALEITADDRIAVSGGDQLGLVYGIYAFSHRFLGVDPLWFWKDIAPAPLASFSPEPQRIASAPPAFRYRGWFINDEDLLASWPASSGQRFRNWPRRAEVEQRPLTDELAEYETRLLRYYTPIAAPDTMERVFEALLRLRGNLIIPASFIDILHEPEAAIIRAAVRRGLFVSQHHVEPLGVSHFAYETWCAQNHRAGAPFSYREAPETMRACWLAHARRWSEIAGDRVIWQVGLRGRGDRPLWAHDPAARQHAGAFIASALSDQLDIVRLVDPRPQPPATLTLWLEGSRLMTEGKLRPPPGITCIFADDFLTQEMQADFETLPREPGRDYGCYYHVAVWSHGPHLVQGPTPSKIARIVNRLHARGDTRYAILNVSNLREHVMGAQCFLEQIDAPAPIANDVDWLARWSPPGLAPLHEQLLAAIPDVTPGFRLYDGAARRFIYDEIRALSLGAPPERKEIGTPGFNARLQDAIGRLEALRATLTDPAVLARIDPRHHSFLDTNLHAQTLILLHLYRALAALIQPESDTGAARAELESARKACRVGERPARWRGWYAHDTKMDLQSLVARLQPLPCRPS